MAEVVAPGERNQSLERRDILKPRPKFRGLKRRRCDVHASSAARIVVSSAAPNPFPDTSAIKKAVRPSLIGKTSK